MQSFVNTNMFVEAFHRLLKVVYLQSKQNRRVDKLLHILFRIARNIVYEQMLKVEKGKMTHRRCEIQKRHTSAVEMASTCTISPVNHDEWKVQSQVQSEVFYTVQRLLETCSCKVKCRDCGACTHLYNCSCMDFAVHSTVCKHVHAVHMNVGTSYGNKEQRTSQEAIEEPEDINDCESSAFNTLEYFSGILEKDNENNVKQGIKILLKKLSHQVESCDNLQTLCTIKSHLSAAMAVMDAKEQLKHLQNERLEEVSDPPPNALHQKQLSFHSTKQKNTTSARWRKPTLDETLNTLTQLNSTEVKVCGICWKEDDIEIEEGSEVYWISCSKCDIWIHNSCTQTELWQDNNYICKNCNSVTT